MALPNDPNTNPGATPPTPPADGSVTPPAEPSYVTEEQLKAEIGRLSKLVENQFNAFSNKTLSANSKFHNDIQTRISTLENAAQAQGITLTESQKKQISDQATIEALQAVAQPGNAPGEQPETEEEARVNFAAEKLVEISGITFEENDPEAKLIDEAAESGDAQKYLKAVQDAINAKKARLASTNQSVPERIPEGGVPGAIPGAANGNPIANITDFDTLWDQAKKQGKI